MEEESDIKQEKVKLTVYLAPEVLAAVENAAIGKRRGGKGGASGVVEAAIRQYLGLQSTEISRQSPAVSDIHQTLNAPETSVFKILERIESASESARDAIHALEQRLGKRLDDIERTRQSRRGDPKPDPDSKKRVGRKG